MSQRLYSRGNIARILSGGIDRVAKVTPNCWSVFAKRRIAPRPAVDLLIPGDLPISFRDAVLSEAIAL